LAPSPAPDLSIDYLIICDHAEAPNGKMYLMGGGGGIIPRQWAPTGPDGEVGQLPSRFALAIGIVVPYTRTHQEIPVDVRVVDADGKPLAQVGGTFRTALNALASPGTSALVPIAMPLALLFPATGTYVVKVKIGDEERDASFDVLDPPGLKLSAS